MTHTHLLTSVAWGKWRKADVVTAPVADGDSREAAFVEDLEPEWIHALQTADYSHLPKLNKITA